MNIERGKFMKARTYSTRQFRNILKINGYYLTRCSGGHEIYQNENGNIIVLSNPLNKMIALRLIKENCLDVKGF
jgi:predicted RNA binding protein YcfA (HicA-like mRNA interferase family)